MKTKASVLCFYGAPRTVYMKRIFLVILPETYDSNFVFCSLELSKSTERRRVQNGAKRHPRTVIVSVIILDRPIAVEEFYGYDELMPGGL